MCEIHLVCDILCCRSQSQLKTSTGVTCGSHSNTDRLRTVSSAHVHTAEFTRERFPSRLISVWFTCWLEIHSSKAEVWLRSQHVLDSSTFHWWCRASHLFKYSRAFFFFISQWVIKITFDYDRAICI